MAMDYFAAIDVSLEVSSVCVVDATDRIVCEAKGASAPEALLKFFGELGFAIVRIGLEAGPLLQGLHGCRIAGQAMLERIAGAMLTARAALRAEYGVLHRELLKLVRANEICRQLHALKGLGVPVVCLDARHAKAALWLRLNKTDANDAEGLAQIRLVPPGAGQEPRQPPHPDAAGGTCRSGGAMHCDVANQIRGALKTFGLVLGKVASGAFEARVRELIAGNPFLVEVIEALLKVWRSTGEQLVILHRMWRDGTRFRWSTQELTG